LEIEERLQKLEKDVEELKQKIPRKLAEHRLRLKEKFDIHDRARNLLSEFEVMKLEEVTPKNLEELKTIIKCLANLVDDALGVEFP
jgi:sugar-specific transcriptional regulator TrmB